MLEVRESDIGQLVRDLSRFTDELQAKVTRAGVRKMAEEILREMRATTAWRDYTGTLRSRMVIRQIDQQVSTVDGGQKTLKGTAALVIAQAPHAALLEYGTAKMRPRPFMTPALEAGAKSGLGRAVSAMRAEFRRVAQRTGGKLGRSPLRVVR